MPPLLLTEPRAKLEQFWGRRKIMALLGDDGRGYELARKLEDCGVWRTWLGDSSYSNFVHFLNSPSTWHTLMRLDDSKSRAQIQLQLRVRALLFDKASISLFLRSNSTSTSSSLTVSKLNPNCNSRFLLNFLFPIFPIFPIFGPEYLWFVIRFVFFLQICSCTVTMFTSLLRILFLMGVNNETLLFLHIRRRPRSITWHV